MSDPWDLASASAEIARTSAELRTELVRARAELEEQLRRPLLDEQERRDLQEVARRGVLGPEMQDVAREIEHGRADWDQVLRGQDEHRTALAAFLERAQAEHGDRMAEVMAQTPAPDDVDDPRPGR